MATKLNDGIKSILENSSLNKDIINHVTNEIEKLVSPFNKSETMFNCGVGIHEIDSSCKCIHCGKEFIEKV